MGVLVRQTVGGRWVLHDDLRRSVQCWCKTKIHSNCIQLYKFMLEDTTSCRSRNIYFPKSPNLAT